MNYRLHTGDCLEVMRTFQANSIDTVITDPPYGLSNHGVDDVMDCLRAWLDGKSYRPGKRGFMGKSWDSWVPGPEVWKECYRVLKPGGMMLVFAGTRSMDLMSMAIRLSGFELRDSIGFAHDGGGAPLAAWIYGSGFPKSMALDKAIDHTLNQTGTWGDYKSADHAIKRKPGNQRLHEGYQRPWRDDPEIEDRNMRQYEPATDAAREWSGWGTSLKPSWEPILLCMKPIDQSFAHNALAHGVAGLNIDGCRIESGEKLARPFNEANNKTYGKYAQFGNPVEPSGRWPANLVLDESSAAALDEMSGELAPGGSRANTQTGQIFVHGGAHTQYDNGGGASRFFYVAKAGQRERHAGVEDGNTHNTVKPLNLMKYLVRLTRTPRGGTVLDPFMGSGSTGVACMIEGRQFVGIDKEAEYVEIARHRIEHWRDEVSTEPRRIKDDGDYSDMPLFTAGAA